MVAVASGAYVGIGVDLINADTYCNLWAAGFTHSGQLRLQVQTSDTDTSGNYTDPTSGAPVFPGAFQSGTILWLNSGGVGSGGLLGVFTSGQSIESGFAVAQGFSRPYRYARLIALNEGSTQFAGPLTAGFISNLRTTGSGGGTSLLPSSGAVNV